MSDIAPNPHASMVSSRRGHTPVVILGMAIGILAASAPGASGQGIAKGVLDRVKDATVYVKLKVNNRVNSAGSGFVINVAGDSILVMTNRHVAVHDEDWSPGSVKPEISVVFRSGTSLEQEVKAKLLSFDHRQATDLAVLEVKGVRQPPAPISAEKLVAESDLFETMTAYTLGFPLGGLLVDGNLNSNPAVTVNAMNISSFRRSEANRLERIQYSGSAIQGNSGGPVVTDKGVLLGVVVERIPGENVGKAIPPNVIASFLGGDVDLIFGKLVSSNGATAKFAIGGRMVDPFNKIRKMTARYVLQSAIPSPPKPDVNGHYPILPNSKAIPLDIKAVSTIRGLPPADAAGYAEFDLPISAPGDRKLYVQVVVTDSFGKSYANKPVATTIPDQPEAMLHDLDLNRGDSSAETLAHWSCEPNLAEGIKMSHEPGMTTINLPGGVAINNMPQNNLFNAPCALVRVNEDFLAAVEILNSFDPGSEGVVLPGGRKFPTSFQSTGLLLWQDEKNFVRFERSKGSDGKISMVNRVLVEVYKNGKEAAIHYIDIPEQPIGLAVLRKGGSLRMLYALIGPDQKVNYRVFREMAVDFDNEILVGVSAANLSKRPFQAKLKGFHLKTPEGGEIAVKPYKMAKLVDVGYEKLADGTRVFEGAGLKVASPANAPVVPQTNMADFKGEWSDNRQLLWNNDKSGQALTLELPVDADGKYEIKAKFTQAPDYAIVKLDLDGRPLGKGEKIDFYAQEVKPTKLLSMGTLPLNKGKRKLTITVFNKNPKSSGYHFGLDEIQLVPAK